MTALNDVRRAARDLADARRETEALEASLGVAIAEAIATGATEAEIAEAMTVPRQA